MALEKPQESLEWATNSDSLIKAPSIEKRKLGYSIDQSTGLADMPSLKNENWFRNLAYKWIKYLDEKVSGINTAIQYLEINDQEKTIELNKWLDLKEFIIPKGTWLLNISFNHSIRRDQQLSNLEQSPIFVSGVSDLKGALCQFSQTERNTEIVKKILTSKGIDNTLYYSYLSKEYEQSKLGTAVENIGFSCIISNLEDKKYYVKNICFSYPNGKDIYNIYYRITAIKIS
ncbi:MAG: hypothetical protein DCC88_00265 [Spirobacillus cienkowskii]|jgi:hypothetical protein|uniref:Uncharacterized protein n=1 Tax=Spirobacillus cienkowskii TaxID=495820 RepID=A0A369L094_9BACT|nr:MAG: hypothetical protein DCC88_00265 [Spirobacillus cienkowskii]